MALPGTINQLWSLDLAELSEEQLLHRNLPHTAAHPCTIPAPAPWRLFGPSRFGSGMATQSLSTVLKTSGRGDLPRPDSLKSFERRRYKGGGQVEASDERAYNASHAQAC